MIQLLELIIITSVWVLGLTIATQEHMVLYGVRVWANKYQDNYKILKALITCPFCMPSIHSLFGYFFAVAGGIVSLDLRLLVLYPIVVMGASILTGFSWTLYDLMSIKVAHIEKLNEFIDEDNFRELLRDEEEAYLMSEMEHSNN